MRTMLLDDRLENDFDRDGYCIVDFLNASELSEIRAAIREAGYGIDNEEKLRISLNQETAERKNEIYAALTPGLQSAADRHLKRYKLMRTGLFDKLPGGGWIRIHQHPHIIDELKYRSVTMWVPLTDTTIDMGTLHVVKGSHKVFVHKIRTHNDYKAFGGVSYNLVKKYSTPLELNEGQAVIFDDKTIHWSPPNKSTKIRTAIQLELIPEECDQSMVIYYRANKHEVLKYRMSGKAYRECALTLKKPDELQYLETVKQPYISYGNRQFTAMMRNAGYRQTNTSTSLFRSLFNRR